MNCEIAFNPTLLSRALVNHHPTLRDLANEIQDFEPLKPPIKLGLRIIYCGFIVLSNLDLFSDLKTPINSSSN